VEHFTETVVEGVAMKAARRSQFGGRVDDAGHDHGDDEIALSAGRGVEDGIQVQVAQATENCGDMAMRKGSGDEEGILQRRRRRRWRAGQDQAEGFDLMGGEMRDVANGAGLDFAVLAVGFAEEDGGGRVTVGYGGDVHAYIISTNFVICKHKITYYMPTILEAKTSKFLKIKGFCFLPVRTSG
jgi:hypothetical protein